MWVCLQTSSRTLCWAINHEANLKGHRIGGVEVSKKHAGFMVNVADSTAQDYEDLIAYVIDS